MSSALAILVFILCITTSLTLPDEKTNTRVVQTTVSDQSDRVPHTPKDSAKSRSKRGIMLRMMKKMMRQKYGKFGMMKGGYGMMDWDDDYDWPQNTVQHVVIHHHSNHGGWQGGWQGNWQGGFNNNYYPQHMGYPMEFSSDCLDGFDGFGQFGGIGGLGMERFGGYGRGNFRGYNEDSDNYGGFGGKGKNRMFSKLKNKFG